MLYKFQEIWSEIHIPSPPLDVVRSPTIEVIIVLLDIAVPTNDEHIVVVDEVDHFGKEHLTVVVLLAFVSTAMTMEVVDNRVVLAASVVVSGEDNSVMPQFVKRGAVMAAVIIILNLCLQVYR